MMKKAFIISERRKLLYPKGTEHNSGKDCDQVLQDKISMSYMSYLFATVYACMCACI